MTRHCVRLERIVRAMKTLGQIAYEGAALATGCTQPWEDATQDKWEAAALAVAASERERICAAIKAEDEHCADGDYMMDSDDCIEVVRGTWKRPEWL